MGVVDMDIKAGVDGLVRGVSVYCCEGAGRRVRACVVKPLMCLGRAKCVR